MEENRKHHILLIYREMIPSIRLCGHCQMEELAAIGKIEYRTCQEKRVTLGELNWADIILLGRLDSWYEYRLVQILKNAGKYLVYIIDDDLLNIPPELSSAAYYGQQQIQHYIRCMIDLSDAILSPSPLLLKKYATDGKMGLLVEEPAINPIEYEEHDVSNPVKIGFAGSVDRTGDIESILENVLKDVKNQFGAGVQFEFFGAIPRFAKDLDAQIIPYCDSYDAYREKLNDLKWDIGLAPMPDTPFHACKHYNKFIEYAAAGCMTIHSAEEPYLRLRAFQCSAFAENNRNSWHEQLAKAVRDYSYREDMRRRACETARNQLNCRRIANMLYEQMELCTSKEEMMKPVGGCIPILKLMGYVASIFAKLRTLRKRKISYILVWMKRRVNR